MKAMLFQIVKVYDMKCISLSPSACESETTFIKMI